MPRPPGASEQMDVVESGDTPVVGGGRASIPLGEHLSADRLHASLDAIADGFAVCSLVRGTGGDVADFRVDYVNEAGATMLGLTRTDLEGGLLREEWHELREPGKFGRFLRQLASGRPMVRTVTTHREEAGRRKVARALEFRISPIGDGFVALWRDTTGAERLVEELREAEARLRALLDQLPMVVWLAGPTGEVEYVNERWAGYTGLPRAAAQGGGLFTTVHPADLARTDDLWRRAVASGLELKVEHRLRNLEGVYRWHLTRARPVRDASGRVTHWLGSQLDIEEEKRDEQERLALVTRAEQARRLESLTVLAGGVAHDFNNLLTVVLGHAEVALAEAPAGRLREALEAIRAAGSRAAELSAKMLAYSGGGLFSVERLELNDLVRRGLPLLRATLHGAVIVVDLAGERLDVLADASQVQQVLLNLVANSVEAVTGRPGGITIRTLRRRVDAAEIAEAVGAAGVKPGEFAAIRVEDRGHGMDAETRTRALEPFFSTRFPGRGLGLPAVLGIARAHGGLVQIDSEPGRGTVVEFLLPLAAPAEPAGRRGRGGG